MRNLVLILLTAVFFLSGCSKPVEKKAKVFPVKIMVLKPATIQRVIKLSGMADSKIHSLVNSPAEGTVNALYAAEGDYVSAGDILCTIMPLDQQNMLGQVRADYEQAKRDFESAGPEEKEAKQKALKEAEENLASAKKLYRPFPVVSPISGMVISKNIEMGNNVSLKQQIMEIANTGRMIVKTSVSEEYLGSISLGQKVRVKISAFPDSVFDGTITVITPKVRVESGTADIEVTIPGIKNVRPGMTAELELVVARKDNALVVPQDILIVKPDGSKYVFITEGNTARMIKVTTGLESNTDIEILTGLKKGDKVVVMGQENLKDGVVVKLPAPQNTATNRTESAK